MAPPTINNQAIKDPQALAGLNQIIQSEEFSELHNGDSDLTQEELGSILDVSNPSENIINEDDAAAYARKQHTLTKDQFLALAREYQTRFPEGSKKIHLNLWDTGANKRIWNPDELLGTSVLNLIGSQASRNIGPFQVSYESAFQVLRIDLISDGSCVFNIWLNTQGQITDLSRDDISDHGLFIQAVLDMEQTGIFLPGTPSKLGIQTSDRETARKSMELLNELKTINHFDINTLPKSDTYTQTNITTVLQGEAMYLEPDSPVGGLFTFDATPCAIVIAILKNPQTGKPQRIGMAHIDRFVNESSITDFFDRLQKGYSKDYKVELHVLSGEKNIALKILKIAQTRKTEIKFFDADLDGSRDDAAIVDKNGVIYYGNRNDLQSMVTTQDILLLQAERQSENSLRFKNEPSRIAPPDVAN